MNAIFSLAELQQHLLSLLAVFLRTGAFVMAAPIFGANVVPARVRLLFALALSVGIAPAVAGSGVPLAFDATLPLVVGRELLMGWLLGFAAQLFMQAFVLAGQLIAMQLGLGFASMVDPGNGVDVTVLGQLYLMLATLLFLSLNGHLVLVQVLVEGMQLQLLVSDSMLSGLFALAAWMFGGGLLIALPAVTALLLVNVALGVLSRSAPQLNVFSIGFPLTLLLGVVVVWLATAGFLPEFDALSRGFFDELARLLG
jgi:flagellar biosynthetic protein FliR